MTTLTPRPLLILICLAALAIPAQGQVFGPDDRLEDGLLRDALEYAADNDVDPVEAQRRLELQPVIGALDGKLATDEDASYAGLFIQHQPEYRVVVLFTDEFARDRLSQHLGGSALRDLVVVRRVQHSLRQLHADQSAARFLAGQLGVRADAGIDIPGNRAELYVLDRAELDDGLAARSMDLPASVNVVQVDELSTVEADIYGGLPLRTCTSGFSVKRTSNGTKGISTAAHCSNSQTYSGTNLPYQSGAYYSQYDVQWHTAPGFTVVNRIRSSCSTCTRSITGTVGRSSQSVGNYVCKQGKTTGYTCGYITDKSYQSSSPSTATATYIRVSRSGVDLSSGGDSGGPWFNGNNAYGIHHSGIGNDATYMAINYISVLGVSVLTN